MIRKIDKYGFTQKIIIMHLVAMLSLVAIAGLFFQTGIRNFAEISEINKIKSISDSLAASLPTMIELGLSKEVELEINTTLARHENLTSVILKEGSFVRKFSKMDDGVNYFEVDSDIRNSPESSPVGKVIIRYSKKEYDTLLHKQLKTLLIMIFVAICFSIASSFYVRYMLRPLSSLAKELVDFDVSNPKLSIKKTNGHDELSVIQGGIVDAFGKIIEYQQEIQNINANLEHIIDERTIELKSALEDLRQKDEMLVVQSRFSAMGEMIANIAHQWRQPLNIIKSSNSLIQFFKKTDKLTDEVFEEQSKNIDRQVEYLSQTIEDFRNFYRDDEKIKFSLREAVEKSIDLVKPSLNSSAIELLTNYNNDTLLLGSQSRLMQAIVNIVNNAKDAINEQNKQRLILITIDIKNQVPYIKISDSGGGIQPSALGKIFEPYFTTKHKSQGTGLGLYMSRLIIEKHFGAKMECANETFVMNDNRHFGAAFTISFMPNTKQLL